MEIKEKEKFIEFKSDNKYSLLRYTKADIKLNKKRKRQFVIFSRYISFVEKLENSKHLSLLSRPFIKSKMKIQKDFKYETLVRCFTNSKTLDDKEEKLNDSEIVPQTMIIYDLLPKEYVNTFSNKYIRFREKALDRKNSFGLNSIIQIIDSFGKMGTRFSFSSTYNIDRFKINSNHELFEYFDSFSLHANDISPSFLCLSYVLNLNDKTKEVFKTIASREVYREGHFLSNGKKNKNNYRHYIGGTGQISKTQAVEDFICELKYEFLKIQKKDMFSKLDELDIVLPNVMIYKSNDITTMLTETRKLIPFGFQTLDLFYNKQYQTCIEFQNHTFDSHNQKFNITNVLIDDSKFQKQEYGIRQVDSIIESLIFVFSNYYLMSALLPEYNRRISQSNVSINLMLQKRHSNFGTLIKLRKKTSSSFAIFDRLLSEYLKKNKRNQLINPYADSEFSPLVSSRGIQELSQLFDILDGRLLQSSDGISQINDFFDMQLKSIESYTNFRTVKISLWVAFLSLLVAILALVLSNENIMEWIEKLLNNTPPQQ